jgi:hypothetical protein
MAMHVIYVIYGFESNQVIRSRKSNNILPSSKPSSEEIYRKVFINVGILTQELIDLKEQ